MGKSIRWEPIAQVKESVEKVSRVIIRDLKRKGVIIRKKGDERIKLIDKKEKERKKEKRKKKERKRVENKIKRQKPRKG